MKNFYKYIPIVIIVLIIVAGVYYFEPGIFDKLFSAKTSSKVTESAMKYINEVLLGGKSQAVLLSVSNEGSVYKLKIKIGSEEYDSYVSKDARFLFPQGYEINPKASPSPTAVGADIPKSDTPDVKLFVMSYCPYGLQTQKALLPVYNLLKNKADIGVYFVSYIMHEKKEIDENLRQYCIQEKEKGKYAAYLTCFVKAGEAEKCLGEASIDRSKLSACVAETDNRYNITKDYNNKSTWVNGTYPKFAVQDDLNKQYGVQGSPSLIINGVEAEGAERIPEKLKQLICGSFNNPPAECSQALSSDGPAPGFGTESGHGDTGGGCAQ